MGMVLIFSGPGSTGVAVAEASANAAGAGGASAALTGTEGVAFAPCAEGISRSIAAFATRPNAIAPATQPSETRPTRANFIVNPTLPLKTQCGIRVNKKLPGSDIIAAIWWQGFGRSTTYPLFLPPIFAPYFCPLFLPIPKSQRRR